MNEQFRINSEQTIQAAREHVEKAVDEAVALGRNVTALWLGVGRNAMDATAATLKTTSVAIETLSQSVAEFSNQVRGTNNQA
ncbi:MAG: hypothetical protein AAGF92_20130 [Myxococcota bacterium]